MEENLFKILFDELPDFVFVYEIINNKSEKFVYANKLTIEKLGYDLEELKNISPNDIVCIDLWSTNVDKFEQVWRTKNDEYIDVEVVTKVINYNNRNYGIAIARDITEKKEFIENIINEKENLEALVDNLTQTRDLSIQSEKMVALGQLIAGVAHEINSPLGAIKASSENLNTSINKIISNLSNFIQNLDFEKYLFIDTVLKNISFKIDDLSIKEKRALKKEIQQILISHNIPDSEIIADSFVYIGLYPIPNEIFSFLTKDYSKDLIEFLKNFVSIWKNSSTISLAVERASKIVFALKKYIHRDLSGKKQPTDIIDTIETVLTLYNNYLKHGIEVVKKFQEVPEIYCYTDEITQVWTNLIHNAIHAMNYKGTLTIEVFTEENFIVVKIIDTGCGIDPDIQDKIFEPFFTTKKPGEGTGLGLDIVKNIVEKHNGYITFKSKPGEGTEFTVRLPIINE